MCIWLKTYFSTKITLVGSVFMFFDYFAISPHSVCSFGIRWFLLVDDDLLVFGWIYFRTFCWIFEFNDFLYSLKCVRLFLHLITSVFWWLFVFLVIFLYLMTSQVLVTFCIFMNFRILVIFCVLMTFCLFLMTFWIWRAFVFCDFWYLMGFMFDEFCVGWVSSFNSFWRVFDF